MKNKVSIRLQGGIGNNLFQIACAYAYSLKYDKELVLLNQKIGLTHSPLSIYKDNILRKINFLPTYDFSKFKIYSEPSFNYNELPFIDGDVYLDGYYQSELYFKEYVNEIVDFFSFPEEFYLYINEKYKNILNKNTCSIHVRRGDYLQLSDHHPVQSINYYMKAIKQMPEDSLFLVFSDDINWCKENFPNIEDKFVFIEGNSDYEDLCLMSLCNNNIIANSSFSWWGAWLNKNIDKKVFVTSKWFGVANNHNTSDLYCESWIKI